MSRRDLVSALVNQAPIGFGRYALAASYALQHLVFPSSGGRNPPSFLTCHCERRAEPVVDAPVAEIYPSPESGGQLRMRGTRRFRVSGFWHTPAADLPSRDG